MGNFNFDRVLYVTKKLTIENIQMLQQLILFIHQVIRKLVKTNLDQGVTYVFPLGSILCNSEVAYNFDSK